MNLNLLRLLLVVLSFSTVIACGDDDENISSTRFEAAAEQYADIVLASYNDSYDEAVKLRNAINTFVDNPTQANFDACKAQWLAARKPYGQTEAYRFYGGPIDDEDGPEGLINAWPMDENFIDYVQDSSDVGLINDLTTYPAISKEVLEGLNESFTEESIFTGYHAIEFLLWGQDLSTTGPGNRPYTDYVTDGSGTAANQDRRGLYLRTVMELLLDNLGSVRDEWKSDGPYRATFLNFSQQEIITKIFESLSELSKGELSGERMFVAVDLQDQENEHSCFADNTIDDIKQNFQGLVNVYTGTYVRVDGTTLTGESYAAIAATADADKAKLVTDAIDNARTKINAIPSPFDQAILNNRQVILDAVTALEELSDRFADVKVVLENQ